MPFPQSVGHQSLCRGSMSRRGETIVGVSQSTLRSFATHLDVEFGSATSTKLSDEQIGSFVGPLDRLGDGPTGTETGRPSVKIDRSEKRKNEFSSLDHRPSRNRRFPVNIPARERAIRSPRRTELHRHRRRFEPQLRPIGPPRRILIKPKVQTRPLLNSPMI